MLTNTYIWLVGKLILNITRYEEKYFIISTSFRCSLILRTSWHENQNRKKGDLTEATYFYADGTIQQKGTFNAKGKLHGTWTSYDVNGNKLAVGNYDNNVKVGKWFFWTDGLLKEVDYIDSRIVSVNEWKDKTKVAVRNR